MSHFLLNCLAIGIFVALAQLKGCQATGGLDFVLVQSSAVDANLTIQYSPSPSDGMIARNLSCSPSCSSATFQVNSDPNLSPGLIYVSGLEGGQAYNLVVGSVTRNGNDETESGSFIFCTVPEVPTLHYTKINGTDMNISHVSVPAGNFDDGYISFDPVAGSNVSFNNSINQERRIDQIYKLQEGTSYTVTVRVSVGGTTDCRGQVYTAETEFTYYSADDIVNLTLSDVGTDFAQFTVGNPSFPNGTTVPGDVTCSNSTGSPCSGATIQTADGSIRLDGLEAGTAYSLNVGYLTHNNTENGTETGLAQFCTKPALPSFEFLRINGTTIIIQSVSVATGGFDSGTVSFFPSTTSPASVNVLPGNVHEVVTDLIPTTQYQITVSVIIGTTSSCGDMTLTSDANIESYTSIADFLFWNINSITGTEIAFDIANEAFATDFSQVPGDVTCSSSGGQCPVNHTIEVFPGGFGIRGLIPGTAYNSSIGYLTRENKYNDTFATGEAGFCTKPDVPTLHFERLNGTSILITNITVERGGFDTAKIQFTPAVPNTPVTLTGNPITPEIVTGLLSNKTTYLLTYSVTIGNGATACGLNIIGSIDVYASYISIADAVNLTLIGVDTDRVNFTVVNPAFENDDTVAGDVTCSTSSGGSCPVGHTIHVSSGHIKMSGLDAGTAYNISVGYLSRNSNTENDTVSGMELFCTKPDVPLLNFTRLNDTAINILSVTVGEGGFDNGTITISPPSPSHHMITFDTNPINQVVTVISSVTYMFSIIVDFGTITACGLSPPATSDVEELNYTSVNDSLILTLDDAGTDSANFSVFNERYPNDITVAGGVICSDSTGSQCTVETGEGKIYLKEMTAGTAYNVSVGYLTRNSTMNDSVSGMETFCTQPSIPTGVVIVEINETTVNITELTVGGNFDNGTLSIDPPHASPLTFSSTTIYEVVTGIMSNTTYNISVVLSVGSTTNCGVQGIVNGDVFMIECPFPEDTNGNDGKSAAKVTTAMAGAVLWCLATLIRPISDILMTRE